MYKKFAKISGIIEFILFLSYLRVIKFEGKPKSLRPAF